MRTGLSACHHVGLSGPCRLRAMKLWNCLSQRCPQDRSSFASQAGGRMLSSARCVFGSLGRLVRSNNKIDASQHVLCGNRAAGLFIFLASASAWAYFWHWTPFSSPCRFDSLDPAAIGGILRFERLIGRQLPGHLRDLAGQEAHLRQLRDAWRADSRS